MKVNGEPRPFYLLHICRCKFNRSSLNFTLPVPQDHTQKRLCKELCMYVDCWMLPFSIALFNDDDAELFQFTASFCLNFCHTQVDIHPTNERKKFYSYFRLAVVSSSVCTASIWGSVEEAATPQRQDAVCATPNQCRNIRIQKCYYSPREWARESLAYSWADEGCCFCCRLF